MHCHPSPGILLLLHDAASAASRDRRVRVSVGGPDKHNLNTKLDTYLTSTRDLRHVTSTSLVLSSSSSTAFKL
eukprot:3601963-Rhodomonas_salina.1